MGKKNKMANHAVEATGLRVISMYVQEYFHWGWQPYGQENDDGIDGEIIPRTPNGLDMGVRIKVQSKSGPGYLSSIDDDYVKIQPYSSKDRLKEHIESWNRSNEPVILVYTNAQKENSKGNKYLDLKNPTAWWVPMNDYKYDGTTLIKIPRKNLFQEHTKGNLCKLIRPHVKDWVHYPQVVPEKEDLKLWGSFSLDKDSKAFYLDWQSCSPTITLGKKNLPLNVSRLGWRHITNKARKERVALSLRLLPIAKKILEMSKDIRPIVLRSRQDFTYWTSDSHHLGYRARVILDGREQKVQVVVKRYRNLRDNKEKFWFYSVHIVK